MPTRVSDLDYRNLPTFDDLTKLADAILERDDEQEEDKLDMFVRTYYKPELNEKFRDYTSRKFKEIWLRKRMSNPIQKQRFDPVQKFGTEPGLTNKEHEKLKGEYKMMTDQQQVKILLQLAEALQNVTGHHLDNEDLLLPQTENVRGSYRNVYDKLFNFHSILLDKVMETRNDFLQHYVDTVLEDATKQINLLQKKKDWGQEYKSWS